MAIKQRFGFTLVEMLVVISIIGVLSALLLPAVQAARESARRTDCLNKQRQLSVANKSYVTLKGRYPGYREKIGVSATRPAGVAISWCVALLPHLDEDALYDEWRDSATPQKPFRSIFFCPSEPNRNRNSATNNYVANAGWESKTDNKNSNGVFLDRFTVATDRTTPEHVVDGDTYTLMFSESTLAGDWWETENADNGNALKERNVFVWHQTTTPVTQLRINDNKGQLRAEHLTAVLARPSSFHFGGVNAAFCDGHVIFLRETIEYQVYIQLMTPNSANSDIPALWNTYKLNEGDYNPS